VTEAAAGAAQPKWRSILALCRVSNLPTIWMNVLTAALLSAAGGLAVEVSGLVVGLLALALSAFYCGGMALNDLFDRDVDAREQPFRPIPAGRISVTEARVVAFALFALGFALLLAAPNPSSVGPGLGLLALIVLYDWLHKRHAASVVLMAACRLMVYPVTAVAIAGAVSGWVWVAAFCQLVYTVLVTVVARYENTRSARFSFPLIPRMIAGMSILDGLIVAWVVAPVWLLAGAAAAALTIGGQRFVRGD
jgi:4-hydroxybenzoate polyprenyltransferase